MTQGPSCSPNHFRGGGQHHFGCQRRGRAQLASLSGTAGKSLCSGKARVACRRTFRVTVYPSRHNIQGKSETFILNASLFTPPIRDIITFLVPSGQPKMDMRRTKNPIFRTYVESQLIAWSAIYYFHSLSACVESFPSLIVEPQDFAHQTQYSGKINNIRNER